MEKNLKLLAFASLLAAGPIGAHPGHSHGQSQGYVAFWRGYVTSALPSSLPRAEAPDFWKKAFISIYKPASIDAASAAAGN